ncbi:MAG: DUF2793 domain-containing protein [Rhodobiaceae bacterium]|nr:DUF2793 domain-containing protein [Rhodobiaceae bacterium]
MSETPRLKLPEIASGQAQKHVTHNDALARLDVLVQVAALTRDQTSPPGSPAEGNIHIVAASATGDWAGQDGKLANWRAGSWSFYDAMPGCVAFVIAESVSVLFDGTDWIDFTDTVPLQDIANLGINTTADATNKLAVRSPAALFSGVEAASGGDGDVRVIVSKEASGDTASHLFQTGFSGRAEFGLTGDDDFHVKVSPDGSAWTDAMCIDTATGNVGFGTTSVATWQMNVKSSDGFGLYLECTGGAYDANIRMSHGSTWDLECRVGEFVIDAVGAQEGLILTTTGSVIAGARAALATTATAGFLYVPTCAGTPTGTPAAQTGKAALVYDTTNNRLYVHDGAWTAIN